MCYNWENLPFQAMFVVHTTNFEGKQSATHCILDVQLSHLDSHVTTQWILRFTSDDNELGFYSDVDQSHGLVCRVCSEICLLTLENIAGT